MNRELLSPAPFHEVSTVNGESLPLFPFEHHSLDVRSALNVVWHRPKFVGITINVDACAPNPVESRPIDEDPTFQRCESCFPS